MRKGLAKNLSIILGVVVALIALLINAFVNPFLYVSDDYKPAKTIETRADANIYFGRSDDNTGASDAPTTRKGGAIYLEEGARYNHKNGIISGHNAKYGGAIYVSSGAVFTMTGGVIKNNSADYGGAIYIESGGVVNLEAGIIFNNTANEFGIDIYLEDGAELNISNAFNINRNASDLTKLISKDTIMVGHVTSGVQMHYMNYGSYPQTYVGNSMNDTLEAWYQANQPQVIEEYVAANHWYGYLYTDGNIYARGKSHIVSGSYIYSTGETIRPENAISWFKVEPLKWIVLNYEDIVNQTTTAIELLSYMGVTGYVTFKASDAENTWAASNLRSWLSSKFYTKAFSDIERENINLKTVLNNSIGSVVDGSGITTQDYIYCLSYSEYKDKYFPVATQRYASATDFALSNYAYQNAGYSTAVQYCGTCEYWTRTIGAGASSAYDINVNGTLGNTTNLTDNMTRPAMQLNINMTNRISSDTIMVGHITNGLQMHYMDFGSYPQSYVGNTMNAELESWFTANNPTSISTYPTQAQNSIGGTWLGYKYTDGNIYARGQYIRCGSYTFLNGEATKVTGDVVWFKVEPIRWIVLNYNEVIVDKTAEYIECLTNLAIASNIQFMSTSSSTNDWSTTFLRSWCNNEFYNNAFNQFEKQKILHRTVLNNVTGNYNQSTSDGSGITTQDYVYCLSYYEYANKYFSNSNQRLCSVTDFALANNCCLIGSSTLATVSRPNGGTCEYWTRSSGSGTSNGYDVNYNGNIGNTTNYQDNGIRPAISIII